MPHRSSQFLFTHQEDRVQMVGVQIGLSSVIANAIVARAWKRSSKKPFEGILWSLHRLPPMHTTWPRKGIWWREIPLWPQLLQSLQSFCKRMHAVSTVHSVQCSTVQKCNRESHSAIDINQLWCAFYRLCAFECCAFELNPRYATVHCAECDGRWENTEQ